MFVVVFAKLNIFFEHVFMYLWQIQIGQEAGWAQEWVWA